MIVEFNCEACGKHRRCRRTSYSPRPRFCSITCKGDWQHRNLRGANHPRWIDVPREKPCEKCGKTIQCRIVTSFLHQRFCSSKCGPGYKWGFGPDNPNWIGGPEARKAQGGRSRSCKEQRDWSRAVLARDDFTCQFCGKRGGDLQADHIKPYRAFPGLRWDLANGRALCKPCHYSTFRSQKTG